MHSRVCPECNAAFQPRYGNQVCCSDECRAARSKRQTRAWLARRAKKQRQTAAAERKEKARRRAAFFAARDAAFERAGLPIPKIVVRNGVRIENRGVVAGRPSGKSSLQISSKSYYYR
jgi:L,D-peptidoglycan transpeptidase YkuD (ErfK/YbiS/YcfS/YnhG family)